MTQSKKAMTRPTTTEQSKFDRIVQSVLSDYLADRTIIYRSESEHRKLHFTWRSRQAKNWTKPSRCMVPDCENPTVERSHTIPKGMSLSAIAEENHVLQPVYNHESNGLILERVGINQASTFPGFCTEHEALFGGFESRGAVVSERDSILQAYRAACRETFRASFHIKQLDQELADYIPFRDQRLRELMVLRVRAAGLKGMFKGELELGSSPIEIEMAEVIDRLRRHAAHFEKNVLPSFERAVFAGDSSGIHGRCYELDSLIPVALSGAGTFYVDVIGTPKRVDMLISVVPKRDRTLIFFCGESSDRNHIDTYARVWMTNALEMLSMIESWMVNGTDQWYLQPSVWDSLTSQTKDAILENIKGTRHTIGHEFEFSIFDQLRRNYLQMLSEIADASSPANIAHAEKHRKKLGQK